MKIAIIGTDYPPMHGGVASWTKDVCMALHQRGHEIVALSRIKQTRDSPFKMIRCIGRSWNSHRAKWIGLAALRLPKVDAALFATWDCSSWTAPRLRKAGTRTISAVHGSEITQKDVRREHLLKSAGAIDLWTPVSGFLSKTLRNSVPDVTAKVLPYPLDAKTRPRKIRPNGPLLMVTRIVESKNIPVAAQLAKSLGRELWVCGDGPQKIRYQKQLDAVKFLGHVPRPSLDELYMQAAGVILCSKADPDGFGAEGLGLCLLEAASRGIPCLGTKVGGIPEALGPGIVFDPEEPDLTAIESHLNSNLSAQTTWDWFRNTHGVKRYCDSFEALL